jgi:hypothetical protein
MPLYNLTVLLQFYCHEIPSLILALKLPALPYNSDLPDIFRIFWGGPFLKMGKIIPGNPSDRC